MRLAYVSRLSFPDPAANAGQTLQMAAALAQQARHAALFVHDSSLPAGELAAQYGFAQGPLELWPLHTRRWPGWAYNHGYLRFLAYNSAVALTLGLHPRWRRGAALKVLFVRSRLETLFWGLARPYLWWLRDWVFACELHDLPPHDPGENGVGARRRGRLARALGNYDLVLAVTRRLAQDIRRLAGPEVDPVVAPLCSGLPRLPAPPPPLAPDECIRLGYTGALDRAHGIPDLLEAARLLPEGFRLRLAGRARDDLQGGLEEAAACGRIELVPHQPYHRMAAEIDACHILLAPAGEGVHATRYRSPLKIFDYLARGKPILAADVPAHRELLQEGRQALFYRPGDPLDLARKILHLSADPALAHSLAVGAWELSAGYTYETRACSLKRLFVQAGERRRGARRRGGQR